jgi:hypothetical protein
MTDADVIFFENLLVHLKESTEIRIIVVIRHRMSVDDLPFGLVWCELELAHFCDFHPQFSHPPDTRAKGRVSGVGWPPIITTHHHEISGIVYRVHTRISPKKSGIGCRVSLGCKTLISDLDCRHFSFSERAKNNTSQR